jgi:hypothetical protein
MEAEAAMTTNGQMTKGRWWFIGAAMVGLVTATVHVFAGGAEVMDPLYGSAVPRPAVAVLDVVWQQITALLLGGSVASLWAAFHPGWRRPVAWLVGGHYLIIAVLFLVLGAYWFQSPWPMPQWSAFLVMVGLLSVGARTHQGSATA